MKPISFTCVARSVALLSFFPLVACANGSDGGSSAAGYSNANGGSGAQTATGGNGGQATATGGGSHTGGSGQAVVGDVRWVGRADASNTSAVKLAWQGAGLIATVTGSEIAVKLNTTGGSSVFFQAVIDGKPGKRFGVNQGADQTVTIGTGLVDGDHLVELYRDSEPSFGTSTFLGFTSGTVKGGPAGTRLVEIVGDSISAGYGDLGSEPHPGWVANPACHQTADNSSWFKTYGALAGHDLGADVSTIAMSGWGMYRSFGGGSLVMSSVYGNTLGSSGPAWGFDPKADAVVINLGTNDWGPGDPGAPYETAYVAFLGTVRAKYPNAHIYLTIGPMLGDAALAQCKTHLANVVATFGDSNVSTFDFGVQNMGSDGSIPTGCDWHPSTTTHAAMAATLESHLRSDLGW